MMFNTERNADKVYLNYSKDKDDVQDDLTLGMLENNTITNLLPFFAFRENDSVIYKYDIADCRPVDRVFDYGVNRKTVLRFLYDVRDVFTSINDYLIKPCQLSLQKETIFYNTVKDTFVFTVLPLLCEEKDIKAQIRDILLLARLDPNQDRMYFRRIMGYMEDGEEFSLFSLAKLISSLDGSDIAARRRLDAEKQRVQQVVELREMESNVQGQLDVYEPEEKKETNLRKMKLHRNEETASTPVIKDGVATSLPKRSAFGGVLIPGADGKTVAKATKKPTAEKKSVSKKQKQGFERKSLIGSLRREKPSENTGKNNSSEVVLKDNNESAAKYYLKRLATGERFPLNKKVIRVGRNTEEVDIYITNNIHVGRVHAVFIIDDLQVFIQDNASSNGTFVNEDKITGRAEVFCGDYIKLGNEEFILE